MIFIDTSALFAIADADDAAHPQARAIFERLVQASDMLITTNYVVVELLTLAQRRLGTRVATRLANEVLPIIEVEFVDGDLHREAQELFLNEARRHLSLVDCATFMYMRRHKIARAFAFDSDFERDGIELLTA